MKKICIIHAAILAAALSASSEATAIIVYDGNQAGYDAAVSGRNNTLVDFENLGNNVTLSSQYSGLTFSSSNGDLKVINGSIYGADPTSGSSGVKVPSAQPSFESFTVIFNAPVSALGLMLLDTGDAPTAKLYNGNTLLDSVSLTAAGDNKSRFSGFVADGDIITRAVFTSGDKNDHFGFDDFRYAKVVPEPSAYFLFAAGVGLAAWRVRTRKEVRGEKNKMRKGEENPCIID